MAKEEILTAMELGSGKIVACLGKKAKDDNKIQILEVNEVFSQGLQNGNVISIEETVSSIQECIEKLEVKTGFTINSVYLGIKGDHIESYNHKGAINITRSDKEITEEDVKLVLEAARQLQISNDREIIETVPLGYTVDKQKGVPNPIGMEGMHLGVNVHIVTASTNILNNIYKCVNRAGFKVAGVAFSPLSVGHVAVMPEEKELGVALIDIGGQVTDITLYIKGGVCFTKEIPIGGDYVTRDIAYGLRTSFSRAKDLKEQYGFAYPSLIVNNEEINFFGVDGITEKSTTVAEISEIIYPRFEEIMKMIKQEIFDSGYGSLVPAGAVITGGSAKIKGICNAAERVLDMPVRLGPPQGIHGRTDITNDYSYATVLGLMSYMETSQLYRKKEGKQKNLFSGIKKILEEIF